MSVYTIALSIITGISVGTLYGLLFVIMRTRAFPSGSTSKKNVIFYSALSSVRLIIFAIIFFYLLRLPSINFIIVLPSFLVMFWIIILKQRA